MQKEVSLTKPARQEAAPEIPREPTWSRLSREQRERKRVRRFMIAILSAALFYASVLYVVFRLGFKIGRL